MSDVKATNWIRVGAVVATVLGAGAIPGHAQEPGPAPVQPAQPAAPDQPAPWHVDWAPLYLWFSGLHGNIGVAGYSVPVDASFSDVVAQLNIAFMTALDARWKRFGLLTDLMLFNLSSDQRSTPIGTLYSGFIVYSKMLIVDPELYWRAWEMRGASIDLLAGARSWRMITTLDLLPGSQPAASASQTTTWVDPVLGARMLVDLGPGWSANLKGDVGGFGVGSDLTWQIYAGATKHFGKTYSVLLAYRYMDVDYDSGAFLYDIHQSGLLAGFAIRFQ